MSCPPRHTPAVRQPLLHPPAVQPHPCPPAGRVLRPCWAPPVSGVAGVASPCSTPWDGGGAVSTGLVGCIGAFASSVARWAQFALGDCPPKSVVCGGWWHSRMTIGWLAGRPDSGQTVWSHGSMRVQVKCACVRPDRGSLTSHQDRTAKSMFGTCPPSTVHLQSTLINL